MNLGQWLALSAWKWQRVARLFYSQLKTFLQATGCKQGGGANISLGVWSPTWVQVSARCHHRFPAQVDGVKEIKVGFLIDLLTFSQYRTFNSNSVGSPGDKLFWWALFMGTSLWRSIICENFEMNRTAWSFQPVCNIPVLLHVWVFYHWFSMH